VRVLPQYSAADLGIHSVVPSSRFVSTKVGLCGTAACLKTRVIVADVATEPLWLYEGHRELALRCGIRAVWSQPILAKDNQVLGSAPQPRPGTLPEEPRADYCARAG
jgi:hypothetical protein